MIHSSVRGWPEPQMGVTKMISVHVKKLGTTHEFDETALPATTIAFLLRYGFKQWLNDGAAVDRKKFVADDEALAEAKAGVEDRIARIHSGDMPTERGESDPALRAQRKFAAELAKERASEAEMAAALEWIKKQRAKSGQRQSA